jgi:hypothetical protein
MPLALPALLAKANAVIARDDQLRYGPAGDINKA